jgi:hypothetical protein
VSGVEERLQLGDRPCGGIVTCKGCHTARRLASETEDSRRLGRRACCAQDGEKGRLVALTVASVKVWLRGSMAEAPGRRRCGGPGRRGRGPKAPRRGTGPPARSGDSTGFSASTAGATKPNIPADAWVLDATRSRQLGSLREVAPCSSSSPRRPPLPSTHASRFPLSQAAAEDWGFPPLGGSGHREKGRAGFRRRGLGLGESGWWRCSVGAWHISTGASATGAGAMVRSGWDASRPLSPSACVTGKKRKQVTLTSGTRWVVRERRRWACGLKWVARWAGTKR